jgi:3-oxoacyl-(acyl-carrier-protein) synthase
VAVNRIQVSGLGAVTPAGWGVGPLRGALEAGQPLATQTLDRPGWDKPFTARRVPEPSPRPAFLAHPRLRRASPLTHYATAAVLEALGRLEPDPPRPRRLGLVVCLQSGCVQYSYRFYKEALEDPATASPLLFPETVFAAPASHIASLLGEATLVHTLVGDPAVFLQGLAMAGDWLIEDRVDAALVVGAEEANWLRADAIWHFDHASVSSAGAGCLCLSADAEGSGSVELTALTDPQTYLSTRGRPAAARAMRNQLPPALAGELLCDGLQGCPRTDAPEREAWRDWTGPRLSLKRILGDGLMAASAWQCVAACDALQRGRFPAATVSVVGCNQQAIAARFARSAKAS